LPAAISDAAVLIWRADVWIWPIRVRSWVTLPSMLSRISANWPC